VNVSRLSNKKAIVTGASKGIGAGIATVLGAAGARVAVNYSSYGRGAASVIFAPLAVFLASDESAVDHGRGHSGRRRPSCSHLSVLSTSQ
jgi:3-oxoacyl-[acyl-carrier protein] reductase